MKILKITKRNFNKTVKETVKAIKNGQIVVCPTDTVYGLLCDAKNKKAIAKLFRIKKRPKGKPISIFVDSIEMTKKFAKIDVEQEKFLKKIWPGKVTVVLRPKKLLPREISQNQKTIGIRSPNHKLIVNLIKKNNYPLAESSANISGKPASTKIKQVLQYFKNQKYQPDLVLDAGNLKKSRPSTVVDLITSPPKILRT